MSNLLLKYFLILFALFQIGIYYGANFQDSVDAYIYVDLSKASGFNNKIKEQSLSRYYNNYGLIKEFNGESDSAIYFYYKSLKQKDIYNKTKTKDYNYLGIIYSNLGDYTASLDAYLKALKTAEESNDSIQTFNITNNLGVLYFDKGNYEYAREHYEKALDIATRMNNVNKIASASKNLADLLLEEKKYSTAISEYLSILDILEKSDYSDLKLNIYNSIGIAYQLNGKLKESKMYFNKCIELSNKTGIHYYYPSVFLYLGKINFLEDNFAKSIKSLNKVDSCLSNLSIPKIKSELLEAYAQYYYKMDNIDSLNFYLKALNQFNKEIYENSNAEKVEYFEEKFEKEKKDKTIQLLAKNNEILDQEKRTAKAKTSKYKIILFSVVGIAILVSLLVMLLLYSLKQRRRKIMLNYQKKELQKQLELEELQKQFKIERIQSELEGEEKERGRIAADLHDGVGSALSGLIMQLDSSGDSKLTGSLKDIYQEIRTISHNLITPTFSENNSFKFLVKSLLKKYLITNHIEASLVWYPEEQELNLAKNQELALLRIFQELFTNILKHSKAKEVVVQFYFEDNILEISIEDNGIGYEVTNKKSNGIGMRNIKKRVSFLQGEIRIESNANGTTTQIKRPINS